MERIINLDHMLAKIEILEGQARLMSAMLVAAIAGIPDKQRIADVMALTWADLQVSMRPDSSKEKDALAEQRNRWNGANIAWNQLQSALEEHVGP